MNYDISENFTEGQWAGNRAFVIGGGPSLKNFNFQQLKNEKVVAVNKAHKCGVADIVFTGDRRWLMRRAPEEGIAPSIPLVWARRKLYKKPVPDYIPLSVHIMKCCVGMDWGRNFRDGVSPGDSGIRAVNFTEILGANPIYLLGFDMGILPAPQGPFLSRNGKVKFRRVPTQAQREWWHNGYNYASVNLYPDFLEHWQKVFDSGLIRSEIINLNPASNLKLFPFSTIKEVL